MVARANAEGVPVEDLRAALDAARATASADGLAWPVDVWERVWAALTPLQQRVVFDHALMGLNYSQIGRKLGTKRCSVSGAWKRAAARMRAAVPPPD